MVRQCIPNTAGLISVERQYQHQTLQAQLQYIHWRIVRIRPCETRLLASRYHNDSICSLFSKKNALGSPLSNTQNLDVFPQFASKTLTPF